MKWLTVARRLLVGAHRVVPYLALALTLVGQPECAAALQALAGLPGVPLPVN